MKDQRKAIIKGTREVRDEPQSSRLGDLLEEAVGLLGLPQRTAKQRERIGQIAARVTSLAGRSLDGRGWTLSSIGRGLHEFCLPGKEDEERLFQVRSLCYETGKRIRRDRFVGDKKRRARA